MALSRSTAGTPARATNPWAVLVVLCTAVFMLLLDTTIVNVAQRKIQLGLDANLSQIQWVMDAYILAFAVLLLTFGRLGDIFGRRLLFATGLVVFTASSALCAASNGLGDAFNISGANALIISRVIQGIGGALMMPQSLSMLTVVFPAEKRGAALGIWGSIVALGAVIGPVLGGYIVTNFAWEWVFIINIPVGIAAVIATLRLVPESTDPNASRTIDWGGVLLSGAGIFALVYALIEGPRRGWTDTVILGLFVVSAVLIVAFVFWELRYRDPIMKVELFRIRNFWVANVLGAIISFGVMGMLFPLSAFLQGALGFSPIRSGLATVPISVAMALLAPFVGRMAERYGPRWFLVAGYALMTVGVAATISQISLNTDWQQLFLPMVIIGIGMSFSFPPMTTMALRQVPPRIAGSASGMINTTRNIGQVLGIAVLGSVLQSRMAADGTSHLAGVGIDQGMRTQIIDLAKANRFDEIVKLVPADQQQLIPQVLNALQHTFADAVQTTLWVAAAVTAVGVVVALAVRNPVHQPATQAATTAVKAEGEAAARPSFVMD